MEPRMSFEVKLVISDGRCQERKHTVRIFFQCTDVDQRCCKIDGAFKFQRGFLLVSSKLLRKSDENEEPAIPFPEVLLRDRPLSGCRSFPTA